jgi:Peptidase family M23
MAEPAFAHPLGMRIYLSAIYLALGLAAAMFAGLAIGGLRGEGPMMVASILVSLGWLGFFAWGLVNFARGWPSLAVSPGVLLKSTRWWLFALVWWAPVVGLLLAFVAFINCGPLWIPNTFHWFGLAMTAVGLAAYYSLPALVRLFTGSPQATAPSHRWWVIVVHCTAVALAWALAWGIPYFALLKDSVKDADYTSAATGFLLPWRGGQDGWVIQGNDAPMNHNNDHNLQKFAFDFRRQCGTPVLAAKSGTVLKILQTNDTLGGDNNYIKVTLDGGGTVASYLHIQTNSAVVAEKQHVDQGDPLARVGCVGNSLTGHIHFHVRASADDSSNTIPVKFDDVDGGIPHTYGSYTSKNRG